VYHNTFISENRNTEIFSNAHFRNNLFLGGDADNRPVTAFPVATTYSTYDYNGYRPNKTGGNQYLWSSPANGQISDYSIKEKDVKGYTTLKNLSEASGLEKHGIEIDYDIFTSMQAPDPATPHRIYHAADINFSLNQKGKAVDMGMILPNVNDGYRGKAPDLGAIEVGEPIPVYGVRGISLPSFYR
ncbi:MAG: hypothetical protein ACSLE0_01060, partial [Chitinophagaceae bacterium]